MLSFENKDYKTKDGEISEKDFHFLQGKVWTIAIKISNKLKQNQKI